MENKQFIERIVYKEVVNWLDEPEIIAISGPRQAGKTTLLQKIAANLKDNAVFINFENTSILEDFQKAPLSFVELQLKGKRTYFFFDEFQYVKNAGKSLKLLFDTFQQAKFIISGSSSLKVRQIASYLVGRVVFFNLYPLSFYELLSYKNRKLLALWQKWDRALRNLLQGKQIRLPEFLFEREFEQALSEHLLFGGYPAVVTSEREKKELRLESLVETYIEKDIIKQMRIGNFLEFKHLVRVLSLQIGNIVNYESLGSKTKLSYREIKRFLSILKETFVVDFVNPFYRNPQTELKKNPKSYFFDLGLRNTLIEDFRSLALRGDLGALVENFVFTQMLPRFLKNKVSFWRTKQGAEVDFVLQFDNSPVPFEVKYQEMKKEKITRSLLSFIKTYQPKLGFVLTKNYCGQIKRDGCQIFFLPVYLI